jgi:phosphoribosyl-ATP pyrophosphohydrolase
VIVPSIDIMRGRAVQLRQGREFMLDGGDPMERLEQFAVAGEVAVIDLDAALGTGSNADLIKDMVRRGPCRVGGGIRSVAAARAWLDAGARRVILGTAATPDVCAQLPRDRVIAAVDAVRGDVVVEGWRTKTGARVVERVEQLAPVVGGFLFTQVEREGAMQGFDLDAVRDAVAAAGAARVTAAGGITTAAEIAALDAVGADAQVGMALYTGRLPLGAAIAAPLRAGQDLWPTVVREEYGAPLGLVWSSRQSLERAAAERRGVYWSRSRAAMWVKGETSGDIQQLVRIDLDCDRDAVLFTVRQQGRGFCHLERRACWPDGFDLAALEQVIRGRQAEPLPDSGTSRLLDDPGLRAAKLREEASELSAAPTAAAAVHEAADVLYVTLVALVAAGGSLADTVAELQRRHGAVSRRPMVAK